jgi:hypothetical protein
MPQDRESGAEAVKYGLETPRKVAELLGASKIGRSNSNEYLLKNKRIVIKCARKNTKSVWVPYHMCWKGWTAFWGPSRRQKADMSPYELNT